MNSSNLYERKSLDALEDKEPSSSQKLEAVIKIEDLFDFFNNISEKSEVVKEAEEKAEELITAFLKQPYINLNKVDRKGNTLLILAAKENYKQIVMKLLKAKADPNIANEHGITALMRAVFNSSFKIASMLIENGANIDLMSEEKKTAFDYAITANEDNFSRSVVNVFLSNNAKIKDSWNTSSLAFSFYADQRDPDILIFQEHFLKQFSGQKDLSDLEKYFNTLKNLKDIYRDKVFDIIKSIGFLAKDLLWIVVEYDAHLEHINCRHQEFSAFLAVNELKKNFIKDLFHSFDSTSEKKLKQIIEPMQFSFFSSNDSINLNQVDKEDNTLLILAAKAGAKQCVMILLEAEADHTKANKEGNTALDEAINNEKLSTVILLLSKGALARNLDSLFDFLQRCDQRDPDVLRYLKVIGDQLQSKLEQKEIEKNRIETNKKSNIAGLLGSLILISAVLPILLLCFLPTTPLGILLVLGISFASAGIGYCTGNKIQQTINNPTSVKSFSTAAPANTGCSTAKIGKDIPLNTTTLAHQPLTNTQVSSSQQATSFQQERKHSASNNSPATKKSVRKKI